jgi:hypothetical protein
MTFDVTNEQKRKIGEIRVYPTDEYTYAVMYIESRKVTRLEISRISRDEIHIDFQVFQKGYVGFTLLSYMLMAVIRADEDVLKDVREFHMSDLDDCFYTAGKIHIKCSQLDKMGYPRCMPRTDNEEKLQEMGMSECMLHIDAMHILCTERSAKRVKTC